MVTEVLKQQKFKVSVVYNGLKRQLEVHPEETMQVVTERDQAL